MNNQIVCKDYHNVEKIVDCLLDEGYVVMLSKEGEFCVINFLWTDGDKNLAVFRPVEEDQEIIDDAINNFVEELRGEGILK